MIIFILMVLDYILTFVGIKNGIIVEGNPIMCFMFQYNFIVGLLFRISYAGIILAMLYNIKKNNIYKYIEINMFVGAIYLYVFNLHFQWLSSTL